MGESVAFATDVAAMMAMTGVWVAAEPAGTGRRVVAVWAAGGGGHADWNGARVAAVWAAGSGGQADWNGARVVAVWAAGSGGRAGWNGGGGWVAVCAAVCSLE